jgi:hypothetical protein
MSERAQAAGSRIQHNGRGRHAGAPADEAELLLPLGPVLPGDTPEVSVVRPGSTDLALVRKPGKVRKPLGGWLLAIVTLGIYALFWYYNLNRELRDFDSSIKVRPGLAVLSLFVPIVGLVSIYNTGARIRHAQSLAGLPPTASGGLGVVLAFLLGLDLPYYNSQSNLVWKAAARA